jgi:DNA-binding transcriptional LysR family regulator
MTPPVARLNYVAMAYTPDPESLRLLVLIDESGSLSGAAAALGLSQPAASKRLSTLERGLGLTLADRTRQGTRLTPAGRVVAGWAQRVLTQLDNLLAGAESLRSQRNAELRVAASMTLAEHLVPAWVGELRRRHPGLYVGLQVTNSEHVPGLVRSGAVDLGFIESPRPPRDLSTRRVARDRLVVVVAPNHPWARRRAPLSAAELAATPLVAREPGSGTRDTLELALSRAGAAMAPPLLEVGSSAAIRSAVADGTGPAVMSELAVISDVADGRLTTVQVEGLDLSRSLRAVWPGGRRLVGPPAELLAAITGKRR